MSALPVLENGNRPLQLRKAVCPTRAGPERSPQESSRLQPGGQADPPGPTPPSRAPVAREAAGGRRAVAAARAWRSRSGRDSHTRSVLIHSHTRTHTHTLGMRLTFSPRPPLLGDPQPPFLGSLGTPPPVMARGGGRPPPQLPASAFPLGPESEGLQINPGTGKGPGRACSRGLRTWT